MRVFLFRVSECRIAR